MTAPWCICESAELSYWQAQSVMAGSEIHVDANDVVGFTRFLLVFQRSTPALTREDVMVTHFDFSTVAQWATSPLSSTDRGNVITLLGSWWTTVRAFTCPSFTLQEIRVYDYETMSPRPGPADLVSAVGTAGTSASGRLPDQIAITATYKSLSRKHWGRSYLPTVNQGIIDTTYGRFTSGHCTAVANAIRTLFQDDLTSGLGTPVIASLSHRALLGIRELQIDNVPDVQRRRRVKQKSLAVSYTS